MEYLQSVYEKIFGVDEPSDAAQISYDTWVCVGGFFPIWNWLIVNLFHLLGRPRKVVCFGNVLLDRTVKLEEPELLQRYELKMGSKGEMDLEQLNKIAADAANG